MTIIGNRNGKKLAYDAIHLVPSLAFLSLFLMWALVIAYIYGPFLEAALLGLDVTDSSIGGPGVIPIIPYLTLMMLTFAFMALTTIGGFISMMIDMREVLKSVESSHKIAWMLLLFAFQPAASLAFWQMHRHRGHASLT